MATTETSEFERKTDRIAGYIAVGLIGAVTLLSSIAFGESYLKNHNLKLRNPFGVYECIHANGLESACFTTQILKNEGGLGDNEF